MHLSYNQKILLLRAKINDTRYRSLVVSPLTTEVFVLDGPPYLQFTRTEVMALLSHGVLERGSRKPLRYKLTELGREMSRELEKDCAA